MLRNAGASQDSRKERGCSRHSTTQPATTSDISLVQLQNHSAACNEIKIFSQCRTAAAVLGAQARRRLTAPGLPGAQGPWIMCSPHTQGASICI